MPHSIRWHYLCLVQLCSRTERLDGRLSRSAALRASDVDDPARALAELAAVGLVVPEAGGFLLPRIGEHVPPPSVRKSTEATRERMRRSRAHKVGDHSLCLSGNCPDALDVTRDVTRNSAEPERVTSPVTRNTGTGRDGTGRDRQQRRAVTPSADQVESVDQITGEVSTGWQDVNPRCSVCHGPMPAAIARAEGWTCHPACDAA